VSSNPAPQSPASKYRLVVAIKYEARIAFIRFVGTHAAYDRIDVEKV
jgi:mRNA interferase HigB